MTRWAMPWKRAVRHLAVALLVGSVEAAFGNAASPNRPRRRPRPTATRAAAPAVSEDVQSKSDPKPLAAKQAGGDGLHHPFNEAARDLDNPPIGCSVPPSTVSGKSVWQLHRAVIQQWDGIRFTTPAGKPIHYSATIVTNLGEIDLDLRPDLAPNHVRNCGAARAGYYDHLFFDRVNHEEYLNNPGVSNDLLEAGCPLR